MTILETVLLALALAMDAFTVGMAVGLHHRQPRQIFRLSFHFGLFQALMPLVGALAGIGLKSWIADWDHWVAFGLLLFIGGRMIYSWFRAEGSSRDEDLTKGVTMVVLSIAVSIDALAVGFTLGLGGVPLAFPILVIGVVAALMTVVGMFIAGRISGKVGRHCELLAGLVLIGIGVRILIEGLS